MVDLVSRCSKIFFHPRTLTNAGREVVEAITRATNRAEYATRFCILVSTGYLQIDRRRTARLVGKLRESLDAVTITGQEPLMERLTEIEEGCVNGYVTDLKNEQAIPGLVRALGSGFGMIPGRLADFGAPAARPVLEAIRSYGNDMSMVRPALVALRYMVEGQEIHPLPADIIEEFRIVAEQWLTESQQTILTLSPAIDLAMVLGDAHLRRIVESLESDANEVIARGVEGVRSVEIIQRRAAKLLAGEPPPPPGA